MSKLWKKVKSPLQLFFLVPVLALGLSGIAFAQGNSGTPMNPCGGKAMNPCGMQGHSSSKAMNPCGMSK